MTRETLLDQAIRILQKAEFIISEKCDIRPRSFDVGARRGKTFLLIKVLSNIEGLGEDTSREMRRLAVLFNGTPIVIGEHTNDHPLEGGAVYLRYGIPCVNIETFKDNFLEEVPPLVYAAPGGLYVEIDGDTLKAVRESKNISLGELAKHLAVSRRAISKYENGMNATIDIALKLEAVLDTPLARPINMLVRFEKPGEEEKDDMANATDLEKEALGTMKDIGFDVFRTAKAPFNALSRDDDNKVLTGVSDYSEAVIKRARFMSSLADVADTYSVFIVKKMSKSRNIGNTVLVRHEDLKALDDSDDLLTMLLKKHAKTGGNN
ncbi:putative HTH-type transcriptional regulator [Methanocella paludicola SANAE]|uniref:Putative HTH-type transcriptional regulatory protein MCP_2870 n=1 Tax=Methanocella paludicola (strain DSM 17711 / JCM 13418 / NBRC 101707 / SANAE) TaxID=304371 RepID=D1Z2M0_METPS|nr:transcriptional regulator [Methanocella paludicola]BAI62942.1 putative HTH-type transcriptional regulator [Methanocella paludicola SANAE]